MLVKKLNPKTKRKEYALVSLDGAKVFQYFGKEKPGAEAVAKVEARIDYYRNKGKS